MNDIIKRTEDSLPLSDQTTGANAMFDPKV